MANPDPGQVTARGLRARQCGVRRGGIRESRSATARGPGGAPTGRGGAGLGGARAAAFGDHWGGRRQRRRALRAVSVEARTRGGARAGAAGAAAAAAGGTSIAALRTPGFAMVSEAGDLGWARRGRTAEGPSGPRTGGGGASASASGPLSAPAVGGVEPRAGHLDPKRGVKDPQKRLLAPKKVFRLRNGHLSSQRGHLNTGGSIWILKGGVCTPERAFGPMMGFLVSEVGVRGPGSAIRNLAWRRGYWALWEAWGPEDAGKGIREARVLGCSGRVRG